MFQLSKTFPKTLSLRPSTNVSRLCFSTAASKRPEGRDAYESANPKAEFAYRCGREGKVDGTGSLGCGEGDGTEDKGDGGWKNEERKMDEDDVDLRTSVEREASEWVKGKKYGQQEYGKAITKESVGNGDYHSNAKN
ncbi:hypothetical protein F3Y22_tig00109924pilonHSYRG00090 [Hibiscus syriacus]|uniref:Uncharacterized protein n=1 Tax=Hibiscus syriacus TaxID=106335 RepID=A0A6A3BTG4_HIBSY|nr:hypothetical protein F3Y22_tig00109924pilonHSYRG00090 [Hibiscus syriacus]